MDIGFKILKMFYIWKGVDLMKSLISIIMPVYNCEAFIKDSINSILSQTYTEWELIIVDDGSKDKTKELIEEFKDNRIQLIKLKKHLGLTAAFKEGYKYIKGEYVLRHDADDTSSAERLYEQKNYLDNNPEAGMVSCLISCTTIEPNFRKDCTYIERIQNHYKTKEEIQKSVLEGFIPLLFPTLMIRRILLDKLMKESSSIYFDDHLELLLKLLQECRVEKIDKILYYYRRHNNAYHIIHQKEYEKYSLKIMKDTYIKSRIQYADFYNEANMSKNKRSELNNDSSVRVLMLIDALNVGGTETHVLNLTRKLMDNGIYVVVATTGGPMEKLFESYGIKIIKIPATGDYISNKKVYGLIKTLKEIIDKEKINIVHCHLFASMQLASELYRRYKLPYIVTIHGLFYPNDVLYSTCIMASKVIAVSEPVKDKLNEKLSSRIADKTIVIPNGINIDPMEGVSCDANIEKELGIRRNDSLLCYCSRLDWNKTDAARALLLAFSQIVKNQHHMHLIIIGDGSGKETIEKEAQIINEMAGKKVVHLLGAKPNVMPFYSRSSIIIGTARVALEGMMCRKPVIAIGNKGYTGIIEEGNHENQWKMYFGDHDAVEAPNVNKIANNINYLMKHPEVRKKIGNFGRKWCERFFNNDLIVKDIIQIYNNILK